MGLLSRFHHKIATMEYTGTPINKLKVRLIALYCGIREIGSTYREVAGNFENPRHGICLGDSCPDNYDDEEDEDIDGNRMYK